MTKKIAVINDLSGFGRCSLTAAISILSAMGVSPCPLPTAILSSQSEYPSYFCYDFTEKMDRFRSEWEKLGASFDGIYTGYVSGEAQIRQIFRFLDTFRKENTFLLVDPVMGDDGIPYDAFSAPLLARMKQLALEADIITPNVTELCLLTGSDYASLNAAAESRILISRITELAAELCTQGPGHVVVTGIRFVNETGAGQMGNLHVSRGSSELFSFPCIGGRYSGTGDLFASCLCAGIARGDRISDNIKSAGKFIELSLADSVREGTDPLGGVNYEKYLSLLI